jgi:uncharacterized membrane protein
MDNSTAAWFVFWFTLASVARSYVIRRLWNGEFWKGGFWKAMLHNPVFKINIVIVLVVLIFVVKILHVRAENSCDSKSQESSYERRLAPPIEV